MIQQVCMSKEGMSKEGDLAAKWEQTRNFVDDPMMEPEGSA